MGRSTSTRSPARTSASSSRSRSNCRTSAGAIAMAEPPSEQSGEEVLYEVDGHVATITLNRPERLNAITSTMIENLSAALLRADQNRAVRAIILTGAGRGFCSGLDL